MTKNLSAYIYNHQMINQEKNMKFNYYSDFPISQHDEPEIINVKIKILIQLYIKCPDPLIADSIAKHIAQILAFPKYIHNPEQRCQHRKLEMHWRCLAWIKTTPRIT